MNASVARDADFLTNSEAWDIPRAAYVHIPFCRRRCFYCDFPISVLGDRLQGEASKSIVQYVEWLCREICAVPKERDQQPLRTVFFGGGTPSLLSAAQVQTILETLALKFGFEPSIEISMEMDPGTFSLSQAQGYREAGVNRVSLGAQAFQDELLQRCGRTHTVRDIHEAVAWLRQAGFGNLSLDLISGLPTQTLPQWEASLEAAIALAPQHISAYDLVVEPGTVFGKRYEPGAFPLPTDDLAAQMYRAASERLRGAGYGHYEISNYAKEGHACAHNQTYWRNASYYGFGMGATSYVQGQRFSRPRTRADYAQWLEAYIQRDGRIDCPITSADDHRFETLMLGLRCAQGVYLNRLQHSNDELIQRLTNCLAPYQAKGWVHLSAENILRLSDPDGFLFSNSVLVTLWETLLDPPK